MEVGGLRSSRAEMWWAAKDSKDQLRGTSAQWATLGVLAKLSNAANVTQCSRPTTTCSAPMKRRHSILVLAQGIEP